VTQNGRNRAKVIKLYLKWAIKVSHKIICTLQSGLQRIGGEVLEVKKPREEAHSVWRVRRKHGRVQSCHYYYLNTRPLKVSESGGIAPFILKFGTRWK
jgi:hypothetical protein